MLLSLKMELDFERMNDLVARSKMGFRFRPVISRVVLFVAASGELMPIRAATVSDWEQISPIFEEIVSAGDTYAYAHDTTKKDAQALWLSNPRKTFVVEEQGRIYGTYYLKTLLSHKPDIKKA